MINIRQYARSFFARPRPEGWGNWVEVRKNMIVHTRGVLPMSILNVKRPNEPDDILEYRKANYRPITKHGINQGIDSVFRILMGSNYQIEFSDPDYFAEKRFSFVETDKPQSLTFEDVFFRHVLRIIFDDPNGWLVWMPINPQDKNLPPSEADPNSEIDVEPLMVPSTRIVDVTEDVFSFEDKEKVLLEVSDKETRKEPTYTVITHSAIWKLIPFWNKEKKEVQYRLRLWYNMSLEVIDGEFTGEVDQSRKFGMAGNVLGGNNTLNKEEIEYFESFFAAYLPFADEAINLFSDNQAVNVRYNFPYVSVKGQKCYTCEGAGKVPHREETGKTIVCQTCQGQKTIPVMSPFSQYIMEPPAQGENENFALADVVKFYHADVNILKHSYEVWNDMLQKAEEAISVKFIPQAQSGVAKDIDRERKYEMLMNISHNLFRLIEWSLDTIEAYRKPFVDDRRENVVKEPQSFAIKTEQSLTVELADMQKASSPNSFIAHTARELGVKVFNENDSDARIVNLLTVWDVLYGKTEDQVAKLKATGAASQTDAIRHVRGYSILYKMSQEDGFMEKTDQEIITEAESQLNVPIQIPQVTPDGIIQ